MYKLEEGSMAMITSTIENLPFDEVTRGRLRKALAWLAETDLDAVANGRNEIDGDELYANVMSVTTSPAASKSFEAHRRYIDVHYVIEGEELIGVAPVDECPVTQEYDAKDDFLLCSDPADAARVTWALLRKGELCVTPPADAHKPACCAGDPAPLRKVCVKVLVG